MAKKKKKVSKKEMYPEGHFVGMWMAIGIALGLPFGIPMGNVSLGIPIGVAIGLAIGTAIEADYKKKGMIRPLTKAEEKRKKVATWIGIGLLVLGVLAFLGFYLLN